jgi:DNA repair exonuclease SbcCD ATPase subunit
MKPSREEKKAQLMSQFEKVVEELLEWEEQTQEPTLTQIEDIVLELREQVGEEMANEILERIGGRTVVPGPACPGCGKEMRYKGQQEKQVESRVGEMVFERGYYSCEECDEGFFPPGQKTRITGQALE